MTTGPGLPQHRHRMQHTRATGAWIATPQPLFMNRHRIPLHWQLAVACSALAATLVLAVLALTESLVVAHFERVAEARVTNVAGTVSNLFQRALERRGAELKLLSRSTALDDLTRSADVRAELRRLADAAPIYLSISVVGPTGATVLVSSVDSHPPGSAAPWLLNRTALDEPSLNDTRPVAGAVPGAASRNGFNLDIGVPLRDARGTLRGWLVAELDWGRFRGLRDEILAHADNETMLSVALFSADDRPLLSDLPALDNAAMQRLTPTPGAGRADRFKFGPDAANVLAARSDLPRRAADPHLGWKVIASQDLDAALRPVRRLQQLVVVSGGGLALAFSILMSFLARGVVRPYAGLLAAVTARFRADEGGAGKAGLTRYLDAITAQLATTPVHTPERRSQPRAQPGVQQPLEVVDMLALIAADASRLQQLLDAMPIGVIVFDSGLRVMYWNRRCEAILGWTAEEVIGRTPFETYAANRQFAEADAVIADLDERGRPTTVTRDYLRRDGSVRHCALIVSRELDAQGRVSRILTMMQDVTDQRVAEVRKARYLHDLSALARQLLDHEAQVTRRLAQSLHDRLGQTLSALRLTFDAFTARRGTVAPEWTDSRMSPLIDQAVAEVREALVELRPPLLDDEGLTSALDNEVRSQARNPNRVRIVLVNEATAAPRYPARMEYAAFMVAREAIGNALRHARAQSIEVRLAGHAGSLLVEVRDDGVGFDAQGTAPRPGHLGLVGMRERALAVDAGLSIESLPGRGSCVRFRWDAATPEPPTRGGGDVAAATAPGHASRAPTRLAS